MVKKHDISKQVWKFQEGLLYVALCSLLEDKDIVYWNYEKRHGSTKKKYTPDGVSIDPDIVIGKDFNKPDALLYVTHSYMQHGSNKKFWRTIAEFFEERALESEPKLYSILYDSNIKPELLKAYDFIFDGTFHMIEGADDIRISNDMLELTKLYGSLEPIECIEILKKYIDDNMTLFNYYVYRVKNMIKNYEEGTPSKFELIKISKNSRIPESRNTFLRVNVCKLYILPSAVRIKIIQGQRTFRNVPISSIKLGLFKKAIGGYLLIDEDLIKFVEQTSKTVINSLCQYANSLPVLNTFVYDFNNINVYSIINKWIIDEYNNLCDKNIMLSYLNDIFDDNTVGIDRYLNYDEIPKSHWLFSSIMTLLKQESGMIGGYGYAQLAFETGVVDGITGGYVYASDFSNRKGVVDFQINEKIAEVFAAHLTRIGKEKAKNLLEDSLDIRCKWLFNIKISTYPLFNPIEKLVEDALISKGVLYEYPVGHASFMSEGLLSRATNTNKMFKVNNGDVWIKCQSAYNGKTDKRKELCGRIEAMKYLYPPEELKHKRFYLVIDGFFNKQDLKLLDIAGWDGIFYYDEIDELMNKIQSII